jgi:hypothetical protein
MVALMQMGNGGRHCWTDYLLKSYLCSFAQLIAQPHAAGCTILG